MHQEGAGIRSPKFTLLALAPTPIPLTQLGVYLDVDRRWIDAGKFLTGFSAVGSIAIPAILAHSKVRGSLLHAEPPVTVSAVAVAHPLTVCWPVVHDLSMQSGPVSCCLQLALLLASHQDCITVCVVHMACHTHVNQHPGA